MTGEPRRVLRVDPAGGGDAPSLGLALARLPDSEEAAGALILVEPGLYREKLLIDIPGLEIRGAGMEPAILTWDDSARKPGPDGRPMRTFASFTLLLGGPQQRLSGLHVRNDAGAGRDVGQAVALYADADGILVEDCRISGCQDSLFLGPLPPYPMEGRDFGGPREGRPRLAQRQLYRGCTIEGDVDFIFGSAQALFEDCRIVSIGPGYVAAPSTPPGSPAGFLFSSCLFEAAPGVPDGSVWLARPWRDAAQAAFLSCRFGPHVKTSPWDAWGKVPATPGSGFRLAGCPPPGKNQAWGPDASDWEKAAASAELEAVAASLRARTAGLV